jgi:hypothetical protein
VQVELAPIAPVQVYPISGIQLLHPGFLPLSQISVGARILSPHIAEHLEVAPTEPVQINPISIDVQVKHPS